MVETKSRGYLRHRWNFARIYLVDRSGTKVNSLRVNPSDLIGNIEELLAEQSCKVCTGLSILCLEFIY